MQVVESASEMSQVARRQATTYLRPDVHAMAQRVADMEVRSMSDWLRCLILKEIREKLGEEHFNEALRQSRIQKG